MLSLARALGRHPELPVQYLCDCVTWSRLRSVETSSYQLQNMHAKSLQSCLTLCDPVDYSPPGSSISGILQQEYLSGLPFPPPGDLPHSGIKPVSLMSPALAGGLFTTRTTWEYDDSVKHKSLKPDFVLVAYHLKRLAIIEMNTQCLMEITNIWKIMKSGVFCASPKK